MSYEGKKPYKYSDELNNWTAAVKRGDKPASDRADYAWKSKFAPHALEKKNVTSE